MPNPFSLFTQLWCCAKRAVPSHVADVTLRRLRFMAQSLGHLPTALAWYEELAREPLASVVAVDHTLYRRLQQPYLCADWKRSDVLASMKSHYSWAKAAFDLPRFEAIYVKNEFVLATWIAERRYVLYLRHCGKTRRFRQEGELILEFECLDQPGELASLSGTVSTDENGRLCFYIGGLQGALKELGAPAIKQTTADMHGLRPKSFMVFAVQALAQHWKCERIMAVGLGNHSYREHERRRLAENASMKFDYDEMWLESGGELQANGFYLIPLVAKRRIHEEIKPNHRSKYKKRYAMMDDIGNIITHSQVNPPSLILAALNPIQ